MLWVATAAGAVFGGTGLLLLGGAGSAAGWGAPWWQAVAQLVCWAGLGISAVGVAVWTQIASRARTSPSLRPWGP